MSAALEGRTAVVTGAGRGIGAEVAVRLTEEGARVVGLARSGDQLDETLHRSVPGTFTARPGDVTDADHVERVLDEVTSRYGGVDVLVNAAGTLGPVGKLIEVDMAGWERAVRVNLIGTALTCRAVLPGMVARHRGSIVNFSGGGATSPRPGLSAYAASKAAVVRLTEVLAQEVAGTGVRVNAVAPGRVDTRMQDQILEAGPSAGPEYEAARRTRTTGVGGTDVGVPVELVAFLTSDASCGLTGRLISAPHDDWRDWTSERIGALEGSPWFTLRRIDPHTIRPLAGREP